VFDRALVQCGAHDRRITNTDHHTLAPPLGARHSRAALSGRWRSTGVRLRVEDTVFAPFSLRFRPFLGTRYVEKMPVRRAFDASTVANTVEKR
jgi:hypothetical protein